MFKTVANVTFWLVGLLVVGRVTAQEDTIRFHNWSDHPIRIALAYTKDKSIDGLGINGYTDPKSFTYVRGYLEIPSKKNIEIEKARNVTFEGEDFVADLKQIRVIVTNGAEKKIVHPKNAQVSYFPIHGNPLQENWWFIARPPFKNAIARWVAEGKNVSEGMFYSLSDYEVVDASNNVHFGVGWPGSESRQIIDEYFQVSAKFDGFTFRVVNQSGVTRDFQLTYFDTFENGWVTLPEIRSAVNGETVAWNLDDSKSVATDGDGNQKIKIEGKDFSGSIVTWGPGLRANRELKLGNGKWHTYIDIQLRP